MKLFLGLQLGLSLGVGLLLYLLGRPESAASFSAGGLLIFFNVFALAIAWSFITQKKLVALSVSLIVFKYAILGVIIYRLLKLPWLDPLWMSAGLSSLVVTTLLFGFLHSLNNQKEE